MAGTIYAVTNNINGNQYVGQTIVKNNKVGHGKLMTLAYKKHGKENFTYETICTGLDNKAILNFAERFWIKVFDSRVPNGYNIEHGGSDRDKVSDETRAKLVQSRKTWSYSEESKAKMSAAQKGRVVSDETKEKLSAANKGKTFSMETKQKLSEAAKRQWAKQRGEA